ncbi:alpha-humulene/(-)-(E)-beta-caryophyllene synthase [Citrus sinensis]|uniref:Alpha-humulene/(-)-(E)-beta-caryophyllene synthase n=1 Tax=Citrus sinensis TaxID=2711 RepID=A0ACB8KNE6_CITSI|nr:alpha-humulene/(-)-(E)-beta-caryophyllene synthase [Citrus sinensis]
MCNVRLRLLLNLRAVKSIKCTSLKAREDHTVQLLKHKKLRQELINLFTSKLKSLQKAIENMSLQVSASPTKIIQRNAEKDYTRRSANFHPSIWGDRFLSYTSDSMEKDDGSAKHQELKEEIRRMLKAYINKPTQNNLDLIDAIQRLGVSYHFESEIDEILGKLHEAHQDCGLGDNENDELYYISLQFRLLRQHGCKISADVFKRFKDSDGNFKTSLAKDVGGMLSLYEATHLGVHEENILDEALAFTTSHLESIAAHQIGSPLAERVKHALIQPIHRGLQRLEARHYIPIYQEQSSHNEALLTFAKLDFNKLQKLHQKELGDISRWDISAIDQLPEYMKLCYRALLDVYSEAEKDLAPQGKLYRLHYAKKAMKNIVKNCFFEAKWCHQNYIPTMDEYMTVALVTSAYPMLSTTSFVGMGDIVTKESFEWLFSNPRFIRASSVVCRLMDDMVSHKFEQSRGHVASSVECYMKQHGATEEEACNEFRKQVSNAWKDINEDCLRPTVVPMPLLMRILNLTRVIDVIYKYEDGYTHSAVVLN